MREERWLSTRTEKYCEHCGEELCLVEPTDVLAQRPIEVELICPTCGGHCLAELTVDQLFRSIFPHLVNIAPAQEPVNDNGWRQADQTWSQTGRMPQLRNSEPPPGTWLH